MTGRKVVKLKPLPVCQPCTHGTHCFVFYDSERLSEPIMICNQCANFIDLKQVIVTMKARRSGRL